LPWPQKGTASFINDIGNLGVELERKGTEEQRVMYMKTRAAQGDWRNSGVVNHANDSEHDGLHLPTIVDGL
jgi:hypothetical protein